MKQIIAVIFLVFVVVMGMNCITYFDPNNQANRQSNQTHSEQDEIVSEEEVFEDITVNITGQVENPGAYVMEHGCFLDEVIAKAGGITETADESCFDYYFILTKNLNIYIPPVTDTTKISINSASQEELGSLAGIGTTLSANIVAYREEGNEFLYLEQIMEVSGIGKQKFYQIRDSICL